MQELLIEKIRTDGGVQSRHRISDEYVTELAELVKTGKRLPPVTVYHDGTDIWMADGFHRLLAHQQAGKRTIRAELHKGGKDDATWASCGSNLEHGLRRTNADKRHAVELALKTRPQLSDKAIAEHSGVGDRFVWQVRQELRAKTPQPPHGTDPVTRVGVDGKTYRIPLPLPPQQGLTRKIPPPPGVPRVPPPPPAPAARTDEVGQAIPDHLLPLFDRSDDVKALLRAISDVRSDLNRAEKSGDPLFGDCNMQATQAALQTAYDAIKATTPYAVCPWCHGTLSSECRGCGHRGVLGKHRWDTTVPRGLK